MKASHLSFSRRMAERLDTIVGGPAIQRSQPRKKPPLLELRDVDAGYGPFRALFGLSFSIDDGVATALLGSNGSGKTTVARVCSGLVKPTEGQILVDGVDATTFSAWELRRLGIAHVPEGRSVFATLTVEENLQLAFRQLLGREETPKALRSAYEMFPILAERRGQIAGTLSGGQQRMLALAGAFPDPPRLLIADELSLGLAPLIVDEVFEALARLRDVGTALLLQKGRLLYNGPTAEIGDRLEEVLPTTVG